MTCSVAIIGCGPSGMFFQHALALRRKKLQEEGNLAAVESLPHVTCFERGSGPGGVWRADRNAGEANMLRLCTLTVSMSMNSVENARYLSCAPFRSNMSPTYISHPDLFHYILQ